jgi:hypothetical protein
VTTTTFHDLLDSVRSRLRSRCGAVALQ